MQTIGKGDLIVRRKSLACRHPTLMLPAYVGAFSHDYWQAYHLLQLLCMKATQAKPSNHCIA